MSARWTDEAYEFTPEQIAKFMADRPENVRRVDRPARDAGLTPGTGHGSPAVARQSAAESPRSAGTHGGRVSSPRPSTVRPLRWPLYVGAALLVIGVVACHHEADGSPLCAEDLPTCGVEVGS